MLDFIISNILPIVGSVVVLLGLLLAFLQFRHTRQKDRVIIEPHLAVFRDFDDSGLPEVFLSNEGPGTAVIEKFDLVVDDSTEYPSTEEGFRQALAHVGISAAVRFIFGSTPPGKPIRPDEKICLLKFKDDYGARIARGLYDDLLMRKKEFEREAQRRGFDRESALKVWLDKLEADNPVFVPHGTPIHSTSALLAYIESKLDTLQSNLATVQNELDTMISDQLSAGLPRIKFRFEYTTPFGEKKLVAQ